MKRPLWISHRGLWEGTDENSLNSYDKAVAAGFDFLETDLRITKDGVVVLAHDPTLERVAGDPRLVHEVTWDEIKEMTMKNGQGFLGLEQFLSRYQKSAHVFDIKAETAEAVLECLVNYPIDYSRSIFLFWKKEHEDAFKEKFPTATCFARMRECKRAGLSVFARMGFLSGIQKGRIYSLPPEFRGRSVFKKRIVNAYRRRGAKILAFLPETAEQVAAAQELGFDYILSNHSRGL